MLALRILLSKNGLTFFLSSIAGWVVASILPPSSWSVFAGMLVTYHLFLGWLLFLDEDDPRPAFSVPVMIVSHLACLALLLGFRTAVFVLLIKLTGSSPVAGLAVFGYLSVFSFILRFGGTCALSYFERDWLFRKDGEKRLAEVKAVETSADAAGAPSLLATATGADHEEWLRERSQQKDVTRLGVSPKVDFERWLQARAKARAASGEMSGAN
jgi:hypothetical protein